MTHASTKYNPYKSVNVTEWASFIHNAFGDILVIDI